jgi:hypothetical protein
MDGDAKLNYWYGFVIVLVYFFLCNSIEKNNLIIIFFNIFNINIFDFLKKSLIDEIRYQNKLFKNSLALVTDM